ncbi:MAG: hypothetical protein JHD28_00485 [Bacteroidia bacterium]|nr:hypothetical protein [Bacteroidia bacterium]
MKFIGTFSHMLVIYSLLIFTTSTFTVATAQNATDSLVINDSNKSTVPIAKKEAHNPIRTPIIIVSTIIGLALVLGTFVFLHYPGKS